MASRDWSMGQHEPFWRTNTSFSPSPSRWDFSFPSDDLQDDSPDSDLSDLSSMSSNSIGKLWIRGNCLYNRAYIAPDGAGLYFSSSPDLARAPQRTPPAIQEIDADDYETATSRGQVTAQLPFRSRMEGTSRNPESRISTPSCSDSSESEHTLGSYLSSCHNISGHRSLLSKPVHPLFQAPRDASETESTGLSDFDTASARKDVHCWSNASSSIDLADIPDPLDSQILGRLCISSDDVRCGLCERFLSQRSPWSSRRIVRSRDLPVAGVLSCCHVFHVECLDQATPNAHKSDPLCPLCITSKGGNTQMQVFPQFRSGLLSLGPSSEHGLSQTCGHMPIGDCLEGASRTPQRNTMLLLNRHRMRKNLSSKCNSSKEFPGKLKKTGNSELPSEKSVDLGAVGCSKITTDQSTSR